MTKSHFSSSIASAPNSRTPINSVHASTGRRGEGVGESAAHPVHPPAPPAAFRVLVTVVEAASMLSIARSHLYLQLQRGQLPSVLIGRSRRILVRDLEAYAEGLRETGF
jgi:excisionase family DNA binding protein